MTPNEARTLENREPLPGGERLYINSTMVPIDSSAGQMSSRQLAEAIQKIYLGVDSVITSDEAREILNREGAGLTGPGPEPPKSLTVEVVRKLMGRLSRPKTLEEIDPAALVVDLNGEADQVLSELAAAKDAGEDVAALRERVKALGGA
jgi:hypothetical protein